YRVRRAIRAAITKHGRRMRGRLSLSKDKHGRSQVREPRLERDTYPDALYVPDETADGLRQDDARAAIRASCEDALDFAIVDGLEAGQSLQQIAIAMKTPYRTVAHRKAELLARVEARLGLPSTGQCERRV